MVDQTCRHHIAVPQNHGSIVFANTCIRTDIDSRHRRLRRNRGNTRGGDSIIGAHMGNRKKRNDQCNSKL